jgi:muramoyltetrapeptide carboxypeptidase
LIAPAGPLLETDDLTRAQELCRALGYQPVLGQNAHRRLGYLAGTDEERLSDLNRALNDPDIDAAWCIRGGYGTMRLLERVDYAALSRHPKPVIGFSDATALLIALNRQSGVITFHGPVARASMTKFTRTHFERVLTCTERPGHLSLPPLDPDILVPQTDRIVTLSGGKAEGVLLGGNLSLLQCLLGTPFFPSLRGALLFLEDVGEDLYRVDRMLAHLRLAGAFSGLSGVLVGRFTKLERSTGDGALGFDEVLATYFRPLGVPVAYGFPIGHVDSQWTLPLGVRARLDAERGELELLEPAVA